MTGRRLLAILVSGLALAGGAVQAAEPARAPMPPCAAMHQNEAQGDGMGEGMMCNRMHTAMMGAKEHKGGMMPMHEDMHRRMMEGVRAKLPAAEPKQ